MAVDSTLSEGIRELIQRLEIKLGQARAISGKPQELAGFWNAGPVEVAYAPNPIPEGSLGRVWRDRQAGRATALLVICPGEADERLAVVGPNSQQPVRRAHAHALIQELLDAASRSQLEAARRLDAALAVLNLSAVPGVVAHGLLTTHYLTRRLSSHRRELKDASAETEGVGAWRALVQALGYSLRTREPDYYVLEADGRALAALRALSEPGQFGRAGPGGQLPEAALLANCQRENTTWGFLAAGERLRLYASAPERGSAIDRWLEIDASLVPGDWRWLLGLFAPISLKPDGLLDQFQVRAADHGTELRERIEQQIRERALPAIARGLGEWIEANQGADLSDPATREEIQEASLTFLFRVLFLLYAESLDFLPAYAAAYQPHSATTIAREARDNIDRRGGSTTTWARLRTLFHAVSGGDAAWGVYAYNGALFAAEDGLPGAGLLEHADVRDDHMRPALVAIGFDDEAADADAGVDYGGLDVGHLGAIYEGLLALKLSRASEALGWDKRRKRYVPQAEPGEDGIAAGQLFFQTEAGGRKGGGVYYTPQLLVRHLVNHSVIPALDEHLRGIANLRQRDPDAASRRLFEFRVLDPAMGSAHFLADALDRMADHYASFLAEHSLPGVRERLIALRREAEGAERAEDAQLLRRLILKRCIYGVDLSPMAVEIGRVSLWLKSFVPGMALSYLGHNLQTGDALVGAATLGGRRAAALHRRPQTGDASVRAAALDPVASVLPLVLTERDSPILRALEVAASKARELADIEDRTPGDVARSQEVEAELREAAAGVRRVLDLWTAEPFGVEGARQVLARKSVANVIADEASGKDAELLSAAQAEAARRHFFHWPAAFPEVFQPDGERPGFDAVVGNPPWNEITIEELAFYALHDPGLRALQSNAEREARIIRLVQQFPELPRAFERLRARLEQERAFFRAENGYVAQGSGDTDVYKLFCERYRHLVREGGRVGVVLPRSALQTKGARGFRDWLFSQAPPERVDFLLNSGRWAFDMEPRYTIALLAAAHRAPAKNATLTMTGPSASRQAFENRSEVRIPVAALGTGHMVPLLPSQAQADVLAKTRLGIRIDELRIPGTKTGAASSRLIPYTELHETKQRRFFDLPRGEGDTPVWKGRSFGQYDPHGRDPAGDCWWGDTFEFVQTKRARARVFKNLFSPSVLADPATHPVRRARIAFSDVTNRTNSRTVIACLIPPKVFLVNSAPYLVSPTGDAHAQMVALGVLNSLPFDWQARRFVELHVSFFLLNMLCFPPIESLDRDAIARHAGRLSCVDKRFAEFAAEADVDCGPLLPEQRDELRAEIDALVAHGYGLSADDLEVVFDDFTLAAVPTAYRDLVRDAYRRLA